MACLRPHRIALQWLRWCPRALQHAALASCKSSRGKSARGRVAAGVATTLEATTEAVVATPVVTAVKVVVSVLICANVAGPCPASTPPPMPAHGSLGGGCLKAFNQRDSELQGRERER